jgi:hypothetical protein
MSDDLALRPPSEAARQAYWRGLSLSQKAALAREVVWDYVRIRWMLRRRELPGLVTALRAQGGSELRADGDQVLTGLRLGRIVGKTLGALPADSRCLVSSLVLTSLLSRRRIASTLVIGVQAEPDFAAHAWVECAGLALLDPGETDYARLTEL